MGLWLFRWRDAQHGGKQKDIIRKFEKSFCFRDAQHGGKQKDIIRKFEKSEVISMRVWLFCSREAPACLEARPIAVLD